MTTSADERVDLSDLDLLDEGQRHCRCTFCYPMSLPPLTPCIGVCGQRYVTLGETKGPPPADACEECLRVFRDPCARCGR